MKETLYASIKDSLATIVRGYILDNGGEIHPITDNHLSLNYYGDKADHELLAMRVGESGIVIVESIVDGEREDDDYTHFSNEEMVQIMEIFVPNK